MECNICQRSFRSNRLLSRHKSACSKWDHSKEVFPFCVQPNHCPLCDREYEVKFDFVNHLMNHQSDFDETDEKHESNVEQVMSLVASFTKTNKRAFKSWNSNGKSKVQRQLFDCKVCKVTYPDECLSQLHKKLHHDPADGGQSASKFFVVSLFECDVCLEKFPSLDELEDHACVLLPAGMDHDELVKDYVPSEFIPIQVIIPREVALDARHSTGDVFKRHLCTICGMLALSAKIAHYHLLRHQSDYFVPGATNVCPQCRSFFTDLTTFSDHIMEHAVKNEALIESENDAFIDFFCEFCEASFRTYKYYESHVIRHRKVSNKNFLKELFSPTSRWKRNEKNMASKKKVSIVSKVSSISSRRSGKKEYQCVYCKEYCVSPMKLGKHVKRFHRGFFKGKKYRCPQEYCDVWCISYCNIARHFRNMHSWTCKVCGKNFEDKQAKQVSLHKIRHQLPKMQCVVCEKYCWLVSCLKSHMRLTHSAAYQKCLKVTRFYEKYRRRRGGDKELGFACERCEFVAADQTAVELHLLCSHSLHTLPNEFTGVTHKHRRVEIVKEMKLCSESEESSSKATSPQVDSPPGQLPLYGTLQLGQFQLPLYRLTPGHIQNLQLLSAESWRLSDKATVSIVQPSVTSEQSHAKLVQLNLANVV